MKTPKSKINIILNKMASLLPKVTHGHNAPILNDGVSQVHRNTSFYTRVLTSFKCFARINVIVRSPWFVVFSLTVQFGALTEQIFSLFSFLLSLSVKSHLIRLFPFYSRRL